MPLYADRTRLVVVEAPATIAHKVLRALRSLAWPWQRGDGAIMSYMGIIYADPELKSTARDLVVALRSGAKMTLGDSVLPTVAVEVLQPILELLAEGRPVWYGCGEHVPNELRPKCAGCSEPLELADPSDPDSWVHVEDANYTGDHTAWLE